MRLIFLPENKRLVFYLAAEEYFNANATKLLSTLPHDLSGKKPEGAFFMWQSRPTVIFGRHQVMEAEVNIPYCQEQGIEMYRRKSGGGCVYSDEGNLMLSYISPSRHSQEVFEQYLENVCEVLRSLGLPAVSTTHNDVLVGGRKVSGNACLLTPHGTIVHGTLLLSSNVEVLQNAITPSEEKLGKHGVESVRQRVVTLEELAKEMGREPFSLQQVQEAFIRHFCGARFGYFPSDEDIRAIREIERSYLDPAFIKGGPLSCPEGILPPEKEGA